MIPKFIQWCKENKLELPVLEGGASIRGGIRPQYPDGYKRSQYPGGYFMPTSATAALDLKNSEKIKSKAAPSGTPG